MAEHTYIHVPFCKSICYYCDFCHVVYQKAMVEKWLDALRKELEWKNIRIPQKTVYIGGGTPTSLNAEEMKRLLAMIDPVSRHAEEYTMEVNPETLTDEKCEVMADHGINRASVGVQTSDDRLLKYIGRHHTWKDVCQCIVMLKQHGIRNISVDLMYGLPGQSLDDLKKGVQDILTLDIQHVSVYSLQIEENTVFERRGIQPCDEDLEADMYDYLKKILPANGYMQYEVSNFAKEGCASQHNLAYWHYKDFYGISCGASGKEGYMRYDNIRNVAQYCRDPEQRELIPLTKEDALFEKVMMGLRLKRGMSLKEYEQAFSESYFRRFGRQTESLIRSDLLEIEGDYVRCTDRGLDILNTVLTELMDEGETNGKEFKEEQQSTQSQ